jgi:hypothetical protein
MQALGTHLGIRPTIARLGQGRNLAPAQHRHPKEHMHIFH